MEQTLKLIFIATLFACGDEDLTLSEIEHTIIGKWELVEYSYSIGGPEQIYVAVTDGHEIIFSADHTFRSSADPPYKNGTYQIDQTELALTYEFDEIDNSVKVVRYAIKFTHPEEFVLVPKNPACIEGCSSKYQKQ